MTATSHPKISIFSSIKTDRFLTKYISNITSLDGFEEFCELVIVEFLDRGASDFLKNSTSDLKNVKIISPQVDFGLYWSWNEAIKNCSGEWVTNANDDDRRLKHNITKVIDAISDCSADVIYHDYFVATDEVQLDITKKYFIKTKMPQPSKHNLVKYCFPMCSPFWKRDLHEKIGWFSNDLKHAADLDFWCRAMENGAEFKKIEDVLGVYYFNPSGQSSSKDQQKLEAEHSVKTRYGKIFGATSLYGSFEEIWEKV